MPANGAHYNGQVLPSLCPQFENYHISSCVMWPMFWFLLRMFLVHLLATHLLSTQICLSVRQSDTEICLRPFVLRQSEVYRVAARMLMKSKSKTKPKPKQRELFLFLAISSALEVNLARFPILISTENLCERACRAHLSRL